MSAGEFPDKECLTQMTAENGAWYYARGQQQIGPLPLNELIRQIMALPTRERTLVYGPGMATWLEARQVPQVEAAMRGSSVETFAPPPLPPGGVMGTPRADEIDYEVFGNEM